MGFDLLKAINSLLKINIKNDSLAGFLSFVINLAIVILAAKIGLKVINKGIKHFFEKQKGSRFGMSDRKADTLSGLLKSILRYVVYFIVIIWIFDSIYPNVKTAIALTSVIGVAVGFGAQSLVKDIISGFFILFEDQFGVGDYVSIEGMTGTVEVLGLRVTKIRDFSGDLHIIPNGSIVKVTNKSRGNMRAQVDINVSYEEDIDRVLETANKAKDEFKESFEGLIGEPEVLGINEFGNNGLVIRVVAYTEPMKQWEAERILRKTIKSCFDNENIRIVSNSDIFKSTKGGN